MISAENLPSGLSVFAVAEVVGPSPYPAKNMSSNTEVVKGANPTWNTSKINPLKVSGACSLCVTVYGQRTMRKAKTIGKVQIFIGERAMEFASLKIFQCNLMDKHNPEVTITGDDSKPSCLNLQLQILEAKAPLSPMSSAEISGLAILEAKAPLSPMSINNNRFPGLNVDGSEEAGQLRQKQQPQEAQTQQQQAQAQQQDQQAQTQQQQAAAAEFRRRQYIAAELAKPSPVQVPAAKAAPKKLESGTLSVKVKGLRHLPTMDTFGKCDPLVKINVCGKKTGSTKAIKNVYDADFSSEGPFVLAVNESSDFSGGVVAHVYDWNLTGQKLIGQASLSQQELKELASLWHGDEVKQVFTKTLTKTDAKGAPLGNGTHFTCFTGKKVQILMLEKLAAVKGHDKEKTEIDLEITWVGGTRFPRITSTKVQTLTLEELYCNRLGHRLGCRYRQECYSVFGLFQPSINAQTLTPKELQSLLCAVSSRSSYNSTNTDT
jgi:hypothetical protein